MKGADFPGIQPLIQTPGVSNLAKEMLGMTADQAPKTLELDNLYAYVELGRRMEPDLLVAQGLVPWACSVTQAAVVGEQSLIQVRSVPGYVTTVLGLEAGNGVSSVEWFVQTSGFLEASVSTLALDTRFYGSVATPAPFPTLPAPAVGFGTTAAIYAGRTRVYKQASAAGVFIRPPFAVTLGPDLTGTPQFFECIVTTANVGMDFNAWGYVKPVKLR